jgi:hypothetical protein
MNISAALLLAARWRESDRTVLLGIKLSEGETSDRLLWMVLFELLNWLNLLTWLELAGEGSISSSSWIASKDSSWSSMSWLSMLLHPKVLGQDELLELVIVAELVPLDQLDSSASPRTYSISCHWTSVSWPSFATFSISS